MILCVLLQMLLLVISCDDLVVNASVLGPILEDDY